MRSLIYYLGKCDNPKNLYDSNGNSRADDWWGNWEYFEKPDGTILGLCETAAKMVLSSPALEICCVAFCDISELHA